MNVLFPIAESTAMQYLLRPDVVFWIFVAVVATGIPGMAMYFASQTRREELQTIAELARAGHSTEEIERLLKKTSR